MSRQRIVQWMLPVLVLVGLAAAASAPADPENENPRSRAGERLAVAQEANDAIKAMRENRENASPEQIQRWSRR